MKNWTNAEISMAISLHNNLLKFHEIANKLNRTHQSVRIKLGKLGYHENNNCYEEIICKHCGNKFKGRIREKRKYCSQSCAAIVNNKMFPKKTKNVIIEIKNGKSKKEKITSQNYCSHCGKPARKKYCSGKCQREYQQKEFFQRIENGDTTLHFKQYKKYLIHKHGNKCMKCGWNEINSTSGLIPIQLEHKDGNSENNNLNNLELLCPNCHSLTPTYMALNKGNGRFKRRERYKNGQSF